MVQGIQFFGCQFETCVCAEYVLYFGSRNTVYLLGETFGCQFVQRELVEQLILAQFVVACAVAAADADTAVAVVGNHDDSSFAVLTGKFESRTASTVIGQKIGCHADRVVRMGCPVDLAAFHHQEEAVRVLG